MAVEAVDCCVAGLALSAIQASTKIFDTKEKIVALGSIVGVVTTTRARICVAYTLAIAWLLLIVAALQ